MGLLNCKYLTFNASTHLFASTFNASTLLFASTFNTYTLLFASTFNASTLLFASTFNASTLLLLPKYDIMTNGQTCSALKLLTITSFALVRCGLSMLTAKLASDLRRYSVYFCCRSFSTVT